MSISLKMQPAVPPMTWEDFCKTSPSYSIALDGYVNDGPKKDLKAPRVNFDHHHNVSRFETRATCAQVLMAVRTGLFDLFKDKKGPHAIVFANDCDQDVCTAWTVLKHNYLARNTMNPILNRLVDIEEKLDATGGAYPYPASLPVLEQLAWVYEPYTQFRLSGGLDKRSGEAFTSIVSDVEGRILKHITGNGSSIPLDTRYKVIENHKGWSVVDEIGAQARTGMISDGIKAYLSVAKLPDKRWKYVIGRISEFIPFPISEILKDLVSAEGNTPDNWGGANTIIGSPRISGSKLSPDEVIKIIKGHVPN